MIKLNSEWNWNDIVIWRVAYSGKRKIETGKWFCKFANFVQIREEFKKKKWSWLPINFNSYFPLTLNERNTNFRVLSDKSL